MNKPVIVAAKRTAIGKIGGMFKHVPPEKLGACVIQALLKEQNISPEQIDEVILGNAIGPGGNIARLTTLESGLPVEVPAVTVDRQCGSGLEAINMACRHIQAGAGDIYIAGGLESSSLAPWKLEKPTSLYGTPTFFTRARFSPDIIGDPEMGVAADNVAKTFHISREAQDNFAYESHQKAVRAQKVGRFAKEIIAIQGKELDEGPRESLNMRTLSRFRPAFTENGTVTAGNACAINDGAAAVLLMSEKKCRELGLTPIMTFMDAASAGVDPNILGIGPIPAVKKLLERTGKTINDIDLVEFNEAFASQVLASVNELNIPHERLNVGGGAIAFGHPYGASGAILVVRLCTEMQRTSANCALATLGIGGGLGLATLFERYDTNDR
ncbi:thiolase family protein [Pseudogracilibacillus auburnensis]|uniref:Acetyl-CoA C-acetyltransferase n=1 Tax=Pseudogracilibacillus auburnensis TaxID=1494959 RepID=A0A2V3WKU7_9BACI|nr:thiolase family protein [Pseudogracilibacillus auburnensis]MBO1001738.1 thiolase family protein [Pseudogracilibacillus auburnensis]PXW89339.1 acetyl-CoA C-acetyltransferase [Pseudogracilibacillus auburnensis]